MNKQVKKQWMEALRSGKYRQGRHQLKYGDSFCSLGVLCDLYPNVEWVDGYNQPNKCGAISANFPDFIQEWAKLDDFDICELIEMNDSEECSFNQIADYIEEYL